MTPPNDPVLRAIMLICGTKDLTPGERIALLVLWRYLGADHKPIGPRLLAYLLSTSRGQAKFLIRRLQEKGYLGSNGTRRSVQRRIATRWITRKLALPNKGQRGVPTPRVSESPRGVGTPSSRGVGTPNDYRSDKGCRLTPLRGDDTPEEKTNNTHDGAVPIPKASENGGGDATLVSLAAAMAAAPDPVKEGTA